MTMTKALPSWIQSNPEFGFGFKALVCHDGVRGGSVGVQPGANLTTRSVTRSLIHNTMDTRPMNSSS